MAGFIPDAGDTKTEAVWFLFGWTLAQEDERKTQTMTPNAEALSPKEGVDGSRVRDADSGHQP